MSRTTELKGALEETDAWIDQFMDMLGWHDRSKSYRAFVAAMHAFRDSLPWDEAAQIAAYFPPLLRGLYFEGWHPTSPTLPLTGRIVFLERVHDSLGRELGIDPEHVVRTLFSLLVRRLPGFELEDAKAVTPEELRAFWPA